MTAMLEFPSKKLPSLWPLSATMNETVRSHCSICSQCFQV
jgi:hypothetical protein